MATLTLESGLKVGIPEKTGSYLRRLLERLTESVEVDAPGTGFRHLQNCFRCLIEETTDLCNSACLVIGGISFKEELLPLPESVGVLTQAVEFLGSEAHRDRELSRLLLDIFFEPDGKTPRKHTRILGLAGRPPARMLRLHDLCEWVPPPKEHPTRAYYTQELRRYLPYLNSWLEAMVVFWAETERKVEMIDLCGVYSAVYRVGAVELCSQAQVLLEEFIPERQLGLPVELMGRVIPVHLPRKAPEPLVDLFDQLDAALKTADTVAACESLRGMLDFLIRYFAGVAYLLWKDLDGADPEARKLAEQSVFISCCEALLARSLEHLKQHPDSMAAKELVSVFFTRNELFEFVPRGHHTEILQLEGVLSAWCLLEPGKGELEAPSRCRHEFERYLPVLRDWLESCGRYLLETEHFFEPVQSGRLEVSVRVADRFLDLNQSQFSLWIEPPAVARDEALAPSRPLRIPPKCPQVLRDILRRLNIYLHQDDPVQACVSLRDSLDYLTRYSAGLAAAAFRELGTLPAEAEEMARNSPSIHQCEKLLILSLKSIGQGEEEDLGRAVRAIFFARTEFSSEDRPVGNHARMLQTDADPNNKLQLLAEFCSRGEGLTEAADCRREMSRFLPVLRDWLIQAEPFFKQAQHFEEPPEEDGQMELVVQFGEHYLELVEPDYTFMVRPGCNEVPEVEIPEPPPEPVVEEPAGAPQEKQKSTEPEKRGPPFLVHRVDFIGNQRNSKGKMCLSGFIRITNAGGGVLSGTAISTHPSIEVTPTRFRGNKTQITYWVDEGSLPQSFQAFVMLRTAEDERQIPVWEMKPRSIFGTMTAEQARIAIWAPPAIGLLVFLLVLFPLAAMINGILTEAAGLNWPSVSLAKDAKSALIQVLPLSQMIGWTLLYLPFWVPLAVIKMYKRLSPNVRDLLASHLNPALFAISPLVFVLTAVLALGGNPVVQDIELPACHLPMLCLRFAGLNVLTVAYLILSFRERIDEWVHDPVARSSIPAAMFFGYFCAVMLALSH
ncbi:MAG: hypothetical protein HY319_06480 [Armatimonadetes bacterium]|nr:hypothetical protein [Armatimonadota bacterium]